MGLQFVRVSAYRRGRKREAHEIEAGRNRPKGEYTRKKTEQGGVRALEHNLKNDRVSECMGEFVDRSTALDWRTVSRDSEDTGVFMEKNKARRWSTP